MTIKFAAVSLSVMLMAGAAAAQDAAPPGRIGNIYNGTAHEPNPGAVHSDESAAGVETSPAVTKNLNNSVQQLDKQVQSNSQPANAAPAESLACKTTASACTK